MNIYKEKHVTYSETEPLNHSTVRANISRWRPYSRVNLSITEYYIQTNSDVRDIENIDSGKSSCPYSATHDSVLDNKRIKMESIFNISRKHS